MSQVDGRIRRLLDIGVTEETLKLVNDVSRTASQLEGSGTSSTLLHRQQLSEAKAFLQAMRPNIDAVRSLFDAVDVIAQQTRNASQALQEAEQDTSHFVGAADKLRQHKAQLEAKLANLRELQLAYRMDEASLRVLAAGPEDPSFFEVFASFQDRRAAVQARATSAQSNTQGLRPDEPELAMDLEAMAKETGKVTDMALEKTLQYCLSHLRDEGRHEELLAGVGTGQGVSSGSGSALAVLLRAVHVLVRYAPHLCRTCQTAVVSARRSAVLRALLETVSATSTSTGAVLAERFVSDTLAWLRARLLEEQEILAALFSSPADLPAGPMTDSGDMLDSVPQLLAAVSDGVTRSLSSRLEWAVSSQVELVPLFRIMDMLQYYGSSFSRILGPVASLCGCVNAAHAACRARLDSLCTIYAARLNAALPSYVSGLAAPAVVVDAALLLVELCRTVSSGGMSIDNDGHAEQLRQTAARSCVQTLVSAVVDGTEAVASALPPEEGSVLSLNVQTSLQAMLAPYALAATVVQSLVSEMAGQEERLVSALSSRLLADTGFLKVLAAVRGGNLGQDSLAEASTACSALVKLIGSPSTLRFESITDPRVRQRLRRDAAGVLSAAYSTVYTHLQQVQEAVQMQELHTPAQVDVLLDLQ